jgi:hypothetical protein
MKASLLLTISLKEQASLLKVISKRSALNRWKLNPGKRVKKKYVNSVLTGKKCHKDLR